MKLTDNEKQIIDNVIENIVVNNKNSLDKIGTIDDFDDWLYAQIVANCIEHLNPMNFVQYEWKTDIENCIRSNAHYIKCVKESKERYNLNQIKKDF